MKLMQKQGLSSPFDIPLMTRWIKPDNMYGCVMARFVLNRSHYMVLFKELTIGHLASKTGGLKGILPSVVEGLSKCLTLRQNPK